MEAKDIEEKLLRQILRLDEVTSQVKAGQTKAGIPWYRHPGTLAALAWASVFALFWLAILNVPVSEHSWAALLFFILMAIGASAIASGKPTGRAKERD